MRCRLLNCGANDCAGASEAAERAREEAAAAAEQAAAAAEEAATAEAAAARTDDVLHGLGEDLHQLQSEAADVEARLGRSTVSSPALKEIASAVPVLGGHVAVLETRLDAAAADGAALTLHTGGDDEGTSPEAQDSARGGGTRGGGKGSRSGKWPRRAANIGARGDSGGGSGSTAVAGSGRAQGAPDLASGAHFSSRHRAACPPS